MTAASITQLRSTGLQHAFVPAPRSVASFFASLCLHVAGLALLVWLPIVIQAESAKPITTADVIHDPNYHVEMLPVLPRMTSPGSLSRASFHRVRAVHKLPEAKEKISQPAPSQPK